MAAEEEVDDWAGCWMGSADEDRLSTSRMATSNC